jgi:alpha-amylase
MTNIKRHTGSQPLSSDTVRRSAIDAPSLEPLEPRVLLASQPWDVSPAPFIQWFESSYETIVDRAPDLFQAGYGAVWTPPPGRGDTSDLTVGYDVYDRFDLGQWDKKTLYGTEEGLKFLADMLHQTGTDLHVDFVMNHNGYSTLDTPGFYDAGGYPGLSITEPSDYDGDFHSAYWGGPEYERLAGLIDIAHEKNYQYIRSPVDPNDPQNLRPGTTEAFGRLANAADPNNARFYPDIGHNTISLFDPATGESNIPVHFFNLDNPLAGDATPENATGYLMRNAQWLIQAIGVDGLRIDAGKHMQGFVFDFFDRAVYRSNPRTLLDGSPKHVFSYSEVFDADPGVLLPHVKKNIDPNDIGRIGGNRDTLDFKWYFAIKDNLENYGQSNAWVNVKDAGLDVDQNGKHDGSAGVKFVENHDVFKPWKLNNVANALMLMLPGNAVVYFNGKEFGDNRDFPKDGRGDALSVGNGSLLTQLLQIRESHGRGNYAERWVDDQGIYIFERVSNAVVGLSNRGDGGFDERTVEVGFAPGTKLVELTGNAADSLIDPFNDIQEVITVWQGGDGKSYATIRVPRNRNAFGDEHQKGFVIYGLGTPQSTGGIELTGVDSVMAGDTDIANSYENGVKRQSDVHVVKEDSLQVRLLTHEVRHLGLDELRDIWADGDNALLKLDGGVDINGNGNVDFVTPGDTEYGFEFFGDKSNPLIGPQGIGGPRGDGEFIQTLDLTQLSEGHHFLEARGFRHRTDGGPASFTSWKESIYVDRLAPDSGIFELRSVNQSGSGDHDIVIESFDHTADNVHVFLDLPASVVDGDVLTMASSGQGLASKVDISLFKTFFGGMSSGNHVLTVVTYEETGTSNVQRIAGQWTDGQGGGLGDLNQDHLINITDIDWFAGLLDSNNTLFNASADFNGDGLIDDEDLHQLGDRLSEVGADQETVDAYDALALLPTITSVALASTAWNTSFINAIDVADSNRDGAYTLPTGSTAQINTLPWTNTNQISVTFDNDVNVAATDLVLLGVNNLTYTDQVNGFNYDNTTFTGTWTFISALPSDKLLLIINDSVTAKSNGNALDGEWENNVSTQSGNGRGGGDFQFRINVLQGDANRNQLVAGDDALSIIDKIISFPGLANYDVFSDINGTGLIAGDDALAAISNIISFLPTGEPALLGRIGKIGRQRGLTSAPVQAASSNHTEDEEQGVVSSPNSVDDDLMQLLSTGVILSKSSDDDDSEDISAYWAAYWDSVLEMESAAIEIR